MDRMCAPEGKGSPGEAGDAAEFKVRRSAVGPAIAVVVAVLALWAAAPARAQTEIWSTDSFSDNIGSGLGGCDNGSTVASVHCSVVLSDDDFTYPGDGILYAFTKISMSSGDRLDVEWDPDLPATVEDLTLRVTQGSTTADFPFAEADHKSDGRRYWDGLRGVAWHTASSMALTHVAQTVQTLVSNLDQTTRSSPHHVSNARAQAFTTGTHTAGYTLSSVDIRRNDPDASTFTAAIWTTGTGGLPDSPLYNLAAPSPFSNGNLAFTAPANATLDAETTYAVVLQPVSGSMGLDITEADDEDAGMAAGWSIRDEYHFSSVGTSNWAVTTGVYSYLIAINGSLAGTTASDASLSGLALTDGGGNAIELDDTFAPDLLAYTAMVANAVVRITVTATSDDADATIGYKDAADAELADADPDADGFQVDLVPGDNVVRVAVAGADGTPTTYAVTVNRGTTVDPVAIPADWSLKPDAVGAGGKFRLLFASSAGRTADSTDIADYNAHVQAAAAGHADMQAFADQFTVVGSTAAVNARANTLTRPSDGDAPIYWVGTTATRGAVADGNADFYDGTWDNPDGRTEAGAAISLLGTDNPVATGSFPSGLNTASALGGLNGFVTGWAVSDSGVSIMALGSADEHPLLGLSPVLRVAAEAPAELEYWSATLTIEEPNGESGPEGFCSADCDLFSDYGGLTRETFEIAGVTHRVVGLHYGEFSAGDGDVLYLQVDGGVRLDLVPGLELRVGERSYVLTDSVDITGVLPSSTVYRWSHAAGDRPWPEPAAAVDTEVRLVDTAPGCRIDVGGRDTVFWSKVTVGAGRSSGVATDPPDYYGFDDDGGVGSLSHDIFTSGSSTDVGVDRIRVGTDGSLVFDESPDLPAGDSALRLHVCGDTFDLANAQVSDNRRTWTNSGLDWSDERPVHVALSAALPDTAAPRVASIVRRTPAATPTNADSLTWRVTFSENVANVDAADFAVSGTTATATVVEATASTVYDVTASGGNLAGLNATATLSFASGQDIADSAGNALTDTAPTGTNENSYVVDNTAPTVTIAVPATSTGPFDATVTFSEAVNGFMLGEISVGNGAASNFTGADGDATYSARIAPTANGTVTVDVAAGAATDAAGNGNTAAAQATSAYTGTSTNRAPVFSPDTTDRTVPENTAAGTAIGAVIPEATDADGDALTYTLEGTDAASFAFDGTTRQISTSAALDHEAKPSHSVTVKAVDTSNASDTIAVTIEVTDVAEKPFKPAAPTVSATANTTDSVDVDWTKPGLNGGPEISGYRLRRRVRGVGAWIETTPAGTGTRASIGSLEADTEYAVQVRALNGETPSDWSDAGFGSTGSASNEAPEFETGPSATRDVDENAAARALGGAFTATDDDGDMLTYSLQSGDGTLFRVVGTSGQLRTRGPLDHESAASHAVTVKVEDGNGGTDTIAVTVDVNDVVEPPQAPSRPTVSAVEDSATSLSVHWSEPANSGPPVTEYDLRYREPGGAWADGPANVPGRSATLGGLAAGTDYEVQVRARNDEGESGWSASGRLGTGRGSQLTFYPGTLSAREGASIALTTLRLEPGLDRTVTVPLTATHVGGATEADYDGIPPSVTFAPEETKKEIRVRPVDDGLDDDCEAVIIGLGTLPQGLSPGRYPTKRIELTDNDGIATWYVSFEAAAYTAAEGGTATVGVVLSEPWKPCRREALVIPLEVSGHGGGATEADYGVPESVTIAEGATRATFTVRAVDDAEDDDGESVTLRFRGPDLPDDLRIGRGPIETVVSLADDDGAVSVAVSFGAAVYTAVEGGAPATVDLRLDRAPGREVTVPLTTTRRGASAGDYSGVPASVVFGAGETAKSFAVTATDDGHQDDGESIDIGFGSLPAAVTAGSPAGATVQLEDDDGNTPKYKVWFDTSASTVRDLREGGCYRVGARLNRAPDSTLALPLVATPLRGATAADYSDLPANLVFEEGEERSGFKVCGVDDTEEDPDEGLLVGFGPLPGGVSGRNGSDVATFVIIDNDGPPGVSIGDAYAREARNTPKLNFRLELDRRADAAGSVRWKTVDGTATAGEDYVAASGTVNFRQGQSSDLISVETLYDEVTEGRETMTVVLSDPLGLRLADATGTGAINDPRGASGVADVFVSGAQLTLHYADPLDAGSTPGPKDWVVRAATASDARTLAVTGVSVLGAEVALVLSPPAAAGESVSVSYLPWAMHPLVGPRGVEAAPLTELAVRNETPPAPAGLPMESLLEAPRIVDDPAAGTAPPEDAAPERPPVLLLAALAQGSPTRLDLPDRGLADISALAGLSELEVLDLSGNRIADVWPLAGLAGLRRLNLSGNRIADVSALAELGGLEVLDLRGNAVADVWPLAGLANLRRLDLSGNRLADVEALAGLAGLEVLVLDGNRVADVLAVALLPRLARLDLAGNRVADAVPLAEPGTLVRLDLAGNRIADASPLGDLSALVWLDLTGNPVADVAPVGRLTALRWLWLDADRSGLGVLEPLAGRPAPVRIELRPAASPSSAH